MIGVRTMLQRLFSGESVEKIASALHLPDRPSELIAADGKLADAIAARAAAAAKNDKRQTAHNNATIESPVRPKTTPTDRQQIAAAAAEAHRVFRRCDAAVDKVRADRGPLLAAYAADAHAVLAPAIDVAIGAILGRLSEVDALLDALVALEDEAKASGVTINRPTPGAARHAKALLHRYAVAPVKAWR